MRSALGHPHGSISPQRTPQGARTFYAELFDWKINVDESRDYGIVAPTPDRLPGGIGQAGKDNPHPAGVVVYFAVNNVEAGLERAESSVASAVPPWAIPGLGTMAVFPDPDGNRVGLWQV